MDSLIRFSESEYFFPIFISLILILVTIFMLILIFGKKKTKKNETVQEVIPEPVIAPPVVEEPVKPVNLDDLPLVKIPIPKIDDSPVEIPISKELIDEGESITIERTEPIIEENINASEIVKVEESQPGIVDAGESVEIPNIVVQNNNVEVDEEVAIPMTKKENLAFHSVPNGETAINENIEIEVPHEYTGEKTEMFEFPDFSEKELESELKLTGNIEEDVIAAANKFISSVMKK